MTTREGVRDGLAQLPVVAAESQCRATDRMRKRLGEFAQDSAGDVLIMFGLMAILMFAMIGAAVDTGRWLNARDQTVNAIDAAVLAAGRALQTNGGNQVAAIAVAEKYYAAAVSNRLKMKSDTIKFVVVDNGTSVTATGTAVIATPFMSFGGVKELPLIKETASAYSKATLAVGGNAELNLEIAMMLDTSGSMCDGGASPCTTGTKINDMKTAAKDLIDIVVWQDQSKFTSKVALIPFSADVRPPSGFPTSVMTTGVSNFARSVTTGSGKKKTTTYYYFAPSVCVGERSGANKYTDVVASSTNPVTRVYNDVGNSSATSASCQIASQNAVVPLTSDTTVLKNKVTSLVAQGGTAGHVGTAWSYYALSPNWSSLFTGSSAPAAYGDDKRKKIAILMTDGEYNYTYDPDKAGTTDTAGTNNSALSLNGQSSASQATQICTQMKARGIEVYTIGYALGGNQTAINTLSNCATDSTKFYNAANGDEIKQAFRDIALKISSLYLSQ